MFVECSYSHIHEHMTRDVPIYVLVPTIRSLRIAEEILVNYPWCRQDRVPYPFFMYLVYNIMTK